MNFELRPYQEKAVIDLISRVNMARQLYDGSKACSSVAFAAVPGAGKTVMMAALIESIICGSDLYNQDADPDAIFLWVTDSPALNGQTEKRFIEASDKIGPGAVIDVRKIDAMYEEEQFSVSTVYLLHRQLLGDNKLLGKHSDSRQVTFWDTLRNTINNPTKHLYLIIDEAHKGIGKVAKKEENLTIYQAIINGFADIPRMPVVIGVSATIGNFKKYMGSSLMRMPLEDVIVPPKDVQDSGLLKDYINLTIPREESPFETIYIKDACRDLKKMTQLWRDYCYSQNIAAVHPCMIVQMQDKCTEQQIEYICSVIEKEIPELLAGKWAMVNVFGDGKTITAGKYVLPYVHPEEIQDTYEIVVVFSKVAISTGWDCPRAEVLYSIRVSHDATDIEQMIGRMIRTPLAKRIDTESLLNEIHCYLPYYDRETTEAIANKLVGDEDPSTNHVVTYKPASFTQKPKKVGTFAPPGAVQQDIFTATDVAPMVDNTAWYGNVDWEADYSAVTPAPIKKPDCANCVMNSKTAVKSPECAACPVDGGAAKPVSAKVNTSGEVTEVIVPDDKNVKGIIKNYHGTNVSSCIVDRNPKMIASLFEMFKQIPTEMLPRVTNKSQISRLITLVGLMAQTGVSATEYSNVLAKLVKYLDSYQTVYDKEFAEKLEDVRTASSSKIVAGRLEKEIVDVKDIDESASADMIEDAYKDARKKFTDLLANLYTKHLVEDNGMDIVDAETYTAALSWIPEVVQEIESQAEKMVSDLFDTYLYKIRLLNASEQEEFDNIHAEDRKPQYRLMSPPEPYTVQLGDGVKPWPYHVLSDKKGMFPCCLRPEEGFVVNTEIGRDSFVAWMRNRKTITSQSLCVVYRISEQWKPCYPDFLFFFMTAEGIKPAIIDPHGAFLGDALEKLKGLAYYAEKHRQLFCRIEAIDKVDGVYRRLDMMRADVRKAIIEYEGKAKDLYLNDAIASEYK